MFQYCRFQKVAVVAGLILFSAGAQAERILNSQPPANENAAKPKHWKTRFEELSLASGKCKSAVDEVTAFFTATEALEAKPAAEITPEAEATINAAFTKLLRSYLMDSQQKCSKRVFMSYMIGLISMGSQKDAVEDTIQDIVGGIVYGNVKLMTTDHEKQLIIAALKAGRNPTLTPYFIAEEDGAIYLNPRVPPKLLLGALREAVQEQLEFYEQMNESSTPEADKRLASFGTPQVAVPGSSNQRL
jgi:hypothetical protein